MGEAGARLCLEITANVLSLTMGVCGVIDIDAVNSGVVLAPTPIPDMTHGADIARNPRSGNTATPHNGHDGARKFHRLIARQSPFEFHGAEPHFAGLVCAFAGTCQRPRAKGVSAFATLACSFGRGCTGATSSPGG